MTNIYIAAGLRTPIGLVGKQFAKEQPEILGAKLINALQNKYPAPIDQVICGNAVGTGGNIGRLMTLYSHLGESVPALTVDMQCASAGAALSVGYAKIKAGMASNLLVEGLKAAPYNLNRYMLQLIGAKALTKLPSFLRTPTVHLR